MKKIAKKKQDQRQPTPTNRRAGDNGLLRIAARLREQVQKIDAGASWKDRSLAVLVMGADQADQIIRVVQIQRDAGVIDAAEARWMIAGFAAREAEKIYEANTDAELKRIGDAIAEAEKAHGLEDDEYWPAGEAPDDVEALRSEWDQRSHQIFADVLCRYGENEMADLALTDHDAFWNSFPEYVEGIKKALAIKAGEKS